MSSTLTRSEIETLLLKQKANIVREINSYPPPIPVCDQQFNYLLAQRAAVSSELRQLRAIPQEESIEPFIVQSQFLE